MKFPADFRWKLGEEIGRGAQAPVAKVTDLKGEFKGTYALKGLAAGRPLQAYERFAKEIKAIKKLTHARIIKVFDHSEPTDDFQFYVMEYVEGARPLKDFLNADNNPFAGNPITSLALFRQIVDAVGHCDANGITHRDLSPANILILPNNDIKLIDFGVCYEAGGEVLTLVDEGVGSRNYTAPECESGGGGPVTVGADLYSAGKILWAAVANMQAFAREKPAFDDKAMSRIFPNPQLWHLQHIFAKTIRRNLGDRFGNAAEALNTATRVERLLSNGNLPLERLGEFQICPTCGWGRLTTFHETFTLFCDPMPPGFQSVRCMYCGYCFLVDGNVMRKNIEKGSSLS